MTKPKEQQYIAYQLTGSSDNIPLNCFSTRIVNIGTVGVLINARILLNVGDSIDYTADTGCILKGDVQIRTATQGTDYIVTVERVQ
jgi:hypothetical protein